MLFKRQLARIQDELYLPLPNELIEAAGITEGMALEITLNAQGHIEIGKPGTAGAAAGQECELCHSKNAHYKCINCGRHACSNCFWELASLCRACAKK